MKKMWSIIEAIKTVEGEFNPEANVIKVPFPLNSLRKCGAFDFLVNHSRIHVITTKKY